MASILAKKISKRQKVSLPVAGSVVASVADGIVDLLCEHKRITVDGLGVFETVKAKPRVVIHPATHEAIEVPEKYKVRFRPAKSLKEGVNK